MVKCFHCGSTMAVRVNTIFLPFYEDGDVIAINCIDRELERVECHLEHLNREILSGSASGELFSCYFLLITFCKAKAAEALEAGEVVNQEEVNKWSSKEEEIFQ